MSIGFAIGLGIIIGVIVTVIIFRLSVSGTLRIDHSDKEDDPYMFLEMDTTLNGIVSKKYVIMKVKFENFISHE